MRYPIRLILLGLLGFAAAPACGSSQPSASAGAATGTGSDTDDGDRDTDGLDYDPKSLVRFELVAPTRELTAGARDTFGALFHIAEGWHIYWINPGDSGLPTRIKFEDVIGATVGSPEFPGPVRFASDGEITNYGYSGTLVVPVAISSAPTDASPRPAVQVRAKATWLACRDDACVPGDGRATLTFPQDPQVATSGQLKSWNTLIATGLAHLPRPISELPTGADVGFEVKPHQDASGKGGVQVQLHGSGDVSFDIFPVHDKAISAVERATHGDKHQLRFALHPEGDARHLAVLAVDRAGQTTFYSLTSELLTSPSSSK